MASKTDASSAELDHPRAGALEEEVTGGPRAEPRGATDHELFRRLVDSVEDYAIFMLDPDGRVASWNRGAERIKGYRADQIIGRHFSIFYPDEDVRAGKCEHELVVAAQVGRFEDEGWRLRKDGSPFWANVVISALRGDHGELRGFSKVTRDLTERMRAEEQRAARLAAEEANRAKDEFLAMLGHELRNPMAPILTALQLIRLRGDEVSKEHQIIERQVRHMLRLIDDLLEVERITRGKIELKKQRLDVRGVIARAIEVASPLLEQRRHHVAVEVPAGAVMVDGDEARLIQVLANLLTNAAKYTDPEGHIAVGLRVDGAELVIEVRDDGIGLDPVLLPEVFDLFVQGRQSSERSRGGLGLGLALVRALTALHGGRVEARSPGPGEGSTFEVRLPIREEAAHDAAPAPAPAGFAQGGTPRRVLVVDDNDDARFLLEEALGSVGHQVRTAGDPIEALALVETFTPEVVVLDIGLPVMDGYELAARLRAAVGAAPLRFIALTGYGQQRDHDRSRDAGFAVHLVKPVDLDQLVACVGDPAAAG